MTFQTNFEHTKNNTRSATESSQQNDAVRDEQDLRVELEWSNFKRNIPPLSTLLTPGSLVSTTSTFAERQEQALRAKTKKLRSIGTGTCGKVFARDGSRKVFKVALRDDDNLWNDYVTHQSLLQEFAKHPDVLKEIKLPKVRYFVGTEDDASKAWWNRQIERFPDGVNLPANMLKTERILPLPSAIRTQLIKMFCHPSLQTVALAAPANRDCLVRIYLGKRREQSTIGRRRMFNLRNFNMHLDQMEVLELPVMYYASAMGSSLAVMHWQAGVDANDVEYVLGSTPSFGGALSAGELVNLKPNTSTVSHVKKNIDFTHRPTQLFVLDFDKVHTMTPDAKGVEQAVAAYQRNDPYFPKPLAEKAFDQKVWASFKQRYLEISNRILAKGPEEIQELPRRFIEGLVDSQQERTRERARAQLKAQGSFAEYEASCA